MISVEDHHLIMLMEECAEAAQRASKQLRFGRDEVQPGQELPNHLRLRDEILDVLAVVTRLQEAGLIEPIEHQDVMIHRRTKQAKVDRMMALSRAQGRLAVETTAERHYQPCEVCGVGHDESTPHKSYLRCALCNSPMPNPVPEVRSCCEAGAEFDRNGFAVNR
jgi:hypothetical protein